MTLREVIYNIKNLKAGGLASDEIEMSDSQYVYIVDYYRATLIRQQQKAGQTINPFVKQTIPIKIKEVGCNYVSVNVLPKPIELHSWDMITQVGDEGFQRVSSNTASWMDYAKYTAKETRWYIKEDKLYLQNYYGLDGSIPVEGVWESPYEVEILKGTINEMDPYNFTYPISSTMLEQIYKLIASGEERWRIEFPKDLTNNSSEGN